MFCQDAAQMVLNAIYLVCLMLESSFFKRLYIVQTIWSRKTVLDQDIAKSKFEYGYSHSKNIHLPTYEKYHTFSSETSHFYNPKSCSILHKHVNIM